MLYRLLLLLLLLPTTAHLSAAQTKAAATPSKASTETQTLEKASQLILDRKYESAFKLLNRFDPKHRRPAIVLKQTELALNYNLRSREYEGFGFRDLEPLERLDSLRARYPRAAIPYPFPVERILLSLKKQYPTNYKISRALGDYYYQVLQCECAEAEKSPNTLMSLIVRNYSLAHAHGYGDVSSYYALGYVRMSQGRFAESVPHFKRAVQLRPSYALAYFNLAYSYNELKQLENAKEAALTAATLFTDDPQMKGDATYLAEDIERRLATTTPANSKTSSKKKM
ncbi:tetratricopeptide repeat protein [Hymenobacter tibetensis]|uniref:Tetratricopeptide repeat protein n=1 Tax=Hymenobacter tibetensis TaxID=497967 RepID=A0ABY4CXD1_9BACT|nr:tetratricopeptide repeat protein [Hymenobacter tibetensis]UOG74928.1 tetratricopeptide repeat protein [Hymenobacter tibetensis]